MCLKSRQDHIVLGFHIPYQGSPGCSFVEVTWIIVIWLSMCQNCSLVFNSEQRFIFSVGGIWCNLESSLTNIQDSSEVNESSVEGKEKLGHRWEVGYGPVAWRSFQRDFVCVRAFFSEQHLWIDNSLKKLKVWCVRNFWQTALGMPQGENNGVKQGSACGSNSRKQLLLKTLSVHVRIL